MTAWLIDPEAQARFDACNRRFAELYEPLMKDVHLALKKAKDDPTFFNRRVAFRAAFSAVEGIVTLLKDQLLAGTGDYSTAEIALLREEDYQLDGRGNAITRTRFLRVADNLLFTWKLFFKGVLPDFAPDLAGDGWRCFLSSLSVRNRITHPRSGSDLEPSEKDMENLGTAFDWVFRTTFQNMAAAILRLREEKYELLDRVLPQRVRQCLDELYAQETVSVEAMQPFVHDLALTDTTIDKDIISMLAKCDLAQVQDGRVILAADCVSYMKWRGSPKPC